jgi:hypothetical protein
MSDRNLKKTLSLEESEILKGEDLQRTKEVAETMESAVNRKLPRTNNQPGPTETRRV